MTKSSMSASNDLRERSEEIRTLVESNDIPGAIKRLMDFVRDFSNDNSQLDEITVLSADLRELETVRRREEIDFQTAKKERRKLIFSALGLMRSVIEGLSLEVVSDG